MLCFRQTKKSTWDVQRSMRYNQDAQRSEGKSVSDAVNHLLSAEFLCKFACDRFRQYKIS